MSRWPCILALVLAGCESRQPVPPLPALSTGSFAPAIKEAVEAARAEAEAKPREARAVGRLGMVLQAHDQRATARACYLRAVSLDPNDLRWRYYLGLTSDGSDSVEAFRAALTKQNYLPAKIKLGEALVANGDSAGAKQVLEGINHPAALFTYGRAVNDATYFEKAVQAFPQYGAALFALAQQRRRTGRSDQAERLMKEYERYKLVAPPIDDPLLNEVRDLNRGPDRLLREAALAESQGQLPAAVELHRKAIAIDPKLVQAHINLISLYGRLGDAASAETHYKEAIALQPNSDEAHYNFGVLCYRSNRREQARAAFTRALELNPRHADAQNNLGVLLEETGRLNEAAERFQKAIELKPDLRLARFHLGRIRSNQRRYPEAITQLELAAEGDDAATPTYLYALGATLARAGNGARAATVLQQARDRAIGRGQEQLAASITRDLAALKR